MSVPQRHLSALLRNDFVTVEITLSGSPNAYTYKAHKTQLAQLSVGGRVVVPGKVKNDGTQSFSIGTVHAIHESAKIDLDAEFKYAWIVQGLDMTAWEALQNQDEKLDEKLVEIERRRKVAEVKETVLSQFTEEERAELFAVPGTHNQIVDATAKKVD